MFEKNVMKFKGETNQNLALSGKKINFYPMFQCKTQLLPTHWNLFNYSLQETSKNNNNNQDRIHF